MKRLVSICLILLSVCAVYTQNLIIEISNVRNCEGNIQIMFFLDAESYKDEAPWQIKRYPKNTLKEGCMTISETLPPGEYGIVLLDDEDNSEKMEYSFLGLPKEGFGFAGYYHKGIRRPGFDQFRFALEAEQQVKKIVIRYF